LVTVKQFTYRGAPEEFSNVYTFQGAPPGDSASWTVLMNDVLAKERAIFDSSVTWRRAYGYTDNDPKKAHAFAHDWTVPGPPPFGVYTGSAGPRLAGDQAGLVWWLLDRKSDKGKPTYLRKYFHHGWADINDHDGIDGSWATALNTFAGPGGIGGIHGGLMSPGGPKDTDPNPGGTVTNHSASAWVTTRTLKRRGKRPKTG
jgi:hypothetical protein